MVAGPFCILTAVWMHRPALSRPHEYSRDWGAGNVEYNRLHVSLSVSWLDYSFCKMSLLRGHKGSLLCITNAWDSPMISK